MLQYLQCYNNTKLVAYYCEFFNHTRIFNFQRDISTVIFKRRKIQRFSKIQRKFNLTANENKLSKCIISFPYLKLFFQAVKQIKFL